jgi:hypothetical protein
MGADINCRLPELFIPFEQIRNNSHGCFRLDGGILVHLPLASTSSDSKRSRFSLLATGEKITAVRERSSFSLSTYQARLSLSFPFGVANRSLFFYDVPFISNVKYFIIFSRYLFCAMLRLIFF